MNLSRPLALSLRLPCLLAAILLPSFLLAATNPLDAVRLADTARVQATIAGDASRLAPLLADELTYAHIDGRLQTKAQLITAVATNRIKYEAYDYAETKFSEVAPGVVAMTGRATLRALAGAERVELSLRFLAVWREEGGKWQLFAYQSAAIPAPPPPAPAPPAPPTPK